MNFKRTYTNPILRGFYPDPSIIRVNEDYYMVNSTFEYFPSIIISHSKDLVNWETVGHGITDPRYLDLSQLDDSHGIWAPDISYYNGYFYIFATLRLNGDVSENKDKVLRRQIVIRSKNPEGPYSKPSFIDIDEIDPSHFIDDNKKHYMVIHPGVNIIELNEDCTKTIGKLTSIWPGTGERCPEGPHILKKDNYYYAILAEGGTGYGHRVSIARSKKLYGPYEECPYNPILRQSDPNLPIQKAGHCKLIQTKNGDWWAVYLCARPNEGDFCNIGRETAIDPVEWTKDGWFVINKTKPSITQTAPDITENKYPKNTFDDFNSSKLSYEWEFVRNHNDLMWSLNERTGYYRIWTGDYDLNSIKSTNTLVRREEEHHYMATTKFEFNPKNNNEQAGLTCYYNTKCYIKLVLIYDNGLKIKLIDNRNLKISELSCIHNIKKSTLYFRVIVKSQKRSFYYSYNNHNWKSVGNVDDCSFLSSDGVKFGKHHTGTMVGIFANNGGTKNKISSDFDWFHYENLKIF
ncbi:MAG: glycoside hydrolase family 43 protein [Clostridiales bacterium]